MDFLIRRTATGRRPPELIGDFAPDRSRCRRREAEALIRGEAQTRAVAAKPARIEIGVGY